MSSPYFLMTEVKMATAKTKTDGSGDDLSESSVGLVAMTRDKKVYPAPHTAHVHPDEVINYQMGGWVRAD